MGNLDGMPLTCRFPITYFHIVLYILQDVGITFDFLSCLLNANGTRSVVHLISFLVIIIIMVEEAFHQLIIYPPSTTSACPCTNEAKVEHKKSMESATSSGFPILFIGAISTAG